MQLKPRKKIKKKKKANSLKRQIKLIKLQLIQPGKNIEDTKGKYIDRTQYKSEMRDQI